jgi:sensor histidine kinase YesM
MNILKKIIRSRIGSGLLFWTISFIILHRLFTIDYNNGWTDILFTLLFHIPLLAVVLLNVKAVDRFLIHKKYFSYLLSIIGMAILGIMVFRLVFGPVTRLMAPHYYLSMYYSILQQVQFLVSYLLVSLLLLLSQNWFYVKERELKLEMENRVANDNLLKAQLNPHFLFNSLNNIYALAKNDPRTRDYLMKLSESLKYMTYETNEDYVLLEDEIAYIKNYFELEKLRLNDAQNIRLTVNGEIEGYLIAPLIFLPFVENCFKHLDRERPFIDIIFKMEKDVLTFQSENNIGQEQLPDGGLGLKNVKNRLELIYKNRHKLKLEKQNGKYIVLCQINLSENDH